jgi:hypothetical protein
MSAGDVFLLDNAPRVGRFVLWLKGLTFRPGRVLKVSVEWVDPKGTDAQRALLRALEGEMAKHCGYHRDELHEILLAHRFGTKRIELVKGCYLERPARRSSDLNRLETSAYIDWVKQRADEMGLRS